MPATSPTYVYVGTYTQRYHHVDGKGEGISVFTLDERDGALNLVSVMRGIVDPAYLALSPDRRFLYSVNETSTTDGQPGGAVSAFAIDPSTGGLTFLNRQSSEGSFPCFVAMDATGSVVLVTNHDGGNVAAFPVRADGSLGPASDLVQHYGSSVHPESQRSPHPHSVNLEATNRFALVCDKGTDKVMVYRIDRLLGKLVPNEPPGVSVQPGRAPRHLAFHPSQRYAFVINEIGSTLTSFAFDPEAGSLREIHTLSTIPANFAERNYTADIRVHPNGKFVYGTNRGHNSIASYAVDEATGRLTSLGNTPTQGSGPRNIRFDPSGTILFAANQNTDTIVPFAVDPRTGSLTPTGSVTHVLTPVCIQFRRPD